MPLAPPRPVVPAERRGARPLSDAAPGAVRGVAAAAVTLLALWPGGEAVAVAVLAAVVVGAAPAVAAVALALAAAAIRWGSTDLAAFAGAQAVLGPAGLTGAPLAAAAMWCAAGALVLATPGGAPPSGRRLGRLPLPSGHALAVAAPPGVLAALLVWGPGGLGGVPERVVATGLAVAAALLVGRAGAPRLRGWLAVAAALVALLLAVGDRW